MTTRCHLFKSIRVIMETANGKQVCLKNLPSNYHPMFSHTHKSKNIMLGFYSLWNADTYGQKPTDVHIQCLYRKGWGWKRYSLIKINPGISKISFLQVQRVASASKQSTRREPHATGKATLQPCSIWDGGRGIIICTLLGNNYFSHCLSIY